MSVNMQQKRAGYAQNYYNMFAEKETMNESIVDFTLLSPHKTSPRWHDIDTITIHCVVGQCTVESLGNWFALPDRYGSSNYGIGFDGRIGQYVLDEDRAWTSGGVDLNGNETKVNGISGSLNDHRAITIEVAIDTFEPYAVTPEAYEGLIKLLVYLCKKYPKIHRLRWKNDKSLVGKVDVQNMTAHRWFALTACPGDYLYNKFGDIAKEVNRRLDSEIIDDVEEENMTVERFKELWDEMREELRDNDSSQWSKEAREWAVSTGLIQGGTLTEEGEVNCMWEDLLTREQLVTVLYRFAQLMGKV